MGKQGLDTVGVFVNDSIAERIIKAQIVSDLKRSQERLEDVTMPEVGSQVKRREAVVVAKGEQRRGGGEKTRDEKGRVGADREMEGRVSLEFSRLEHADACGSAVEETERQRGVLRPRACQMEGSPSGREGEGELDWCGEMRGRREEAPCDVTVADMERGLDCSTLRDALESEGRERVSEMIQQLLGDCSVVAFDGSVEKLQRRETCWQFRTEREDDVELDGTSQNNSNENWSHRR